METDAIEPKDVILWIREHTKDIYFILVVILALVLLWHDLTVTGMYNELVDTYNSLYLNCLIWK